MHCMDELWQQQRQLASVYAISSTHSHSAVSANRCQHTTSGNHKLGALFEVVEAKCMFSIINYCNLIIAPQNMLLRLCFAALAIKS